ncbi:ATP-binding cassette domain-containing protein [Humibacter sp.]|uniref:ATP-binding cassette domain-containing protein n=1 Tax=Humibacter sp. TaxID=1940291 RepID=UPI003F7EEA6A
MNATSSTISVQASDSVQASEATQATDSAQTSETSATADTHDTIRVHGARENNLKDVDVELPKRKLTVFTGVSGSGKSSLVFSTIAAESQRLINETYSAFVQGFMPSLSRPDVDVLEGLTTAITVDQERIGSDPRSTVGTATDANAMLRILFSRLGEPHIGSPQAYSFNVASVSGSGAITFDRAQGGSTKERRSFSVTGGMCPRCEGRGTVQDFDLTQLYDASKSLNDGALLVPNHTRDSWYVRIYRESGYLDPDKPIAKYGKRELNDLLYREPTRIKVNGINVWYMGLILRIQQSFLSKDLDSMQPHIRAFVERAITFGTCPECGGTRLNEGARSSKIEGVSIADACGMQITDLTEWVRGLVAHANGSDARFRPLAPLLKSLLHLLESFVEIGLGYLSLDRSSGTLSGGEAQRTKMIRHLGSALTDVTYVFDEPSIGLHPHDVQRMNRLLLRLRDKGNTVLVVEHKPELIEIADHAVDLGPGAGAAGGSICFEGTVDGLRASDTVTGRHLGDRARLKESVRQASGALEVRGANTHNLRDVDVDIPLGVLVVVTGVAGSGKSSLITGSVSPRDGVVTVDQTPIKGSRRSNPATYTGLLDPIRKAFAKANGVKPALFSSNSEGACPVCNGAGVIYTDLGIMATVATVCEECGGKRFSAEVLEYKLGGTGGSGSAGSGSDEGNGGKNISEVLGMSVLDAREFFSEGPARTPAAAAILDRLADVGLGYLTIGQPLTTLSGGERQRLKLATHMGEKGGVLILDEPTTGLHLADVEQLLALLDRLVDSGKSVIVVEHHQAVMAHADWIIDLGPGAGHDGGRVVFEGTPADLVASRSTLTGEYLAEYVRV